MSFTKAIKVIPAIDIYDGKCVRLAQGRFEDVVAYHGSPLSFAQKWEEAGAERLHIVDLNAANGTGDNFSLIHKIVHKTSAMIQVGGGIRTIEAVKRYWGLGVSRLILGTAAIEDPDLIYKAGSLLGEALLVDIAARRGMVVGRGWTSQTEIPAPELLLRLPLLGVKRIVYTDTARDGMLGGPNFAEIEAIVKYARDLTDPIKVTASGGTSSINDLLQLQQIGVDENIVGKALYENKFTIGDVRAAFS